MEELQNLMGMVTFSVGTDSPPKTSFPLDCLGGSTIERTVRSFTKLFGSLGGVDNLVFYPTDNEIYKTDNTYPVYSKEDYSVAEAVVKVVDISKVHEEYKLQVEVVNVMLEE